MLSAETHKGNRKATGQESYGRFLYNRFRYYDPGIGRYVSADPIGQFGGVNVYDYAGQNPTFSVDPDARHPVAIGVGVACLVVGAAAAVKSHVDAAETIEAANKAAREAEALNEFAKQYDELARCEDDPAKKRFFEEAAEDARQQALKVLSDAAKSQASGSVDSLVTSAVQAGATACVGAAVAIGIVLSGG